MYMYIVSYTMYVSIVMMQKYVRCQCESLHYVVPTEVCLIHIEPMESIVVGPCFQRTIVTQANVNKNN